MFAISGPSFGLQHQRIGRIFGRQPKSHCRSHRPTFPRSRRPVPSHACRRPCRGGHAGHCGKQSRRMKRCLTAASSHVTSSKPERRAFALAGCGTRRISRFEVVQGGEELSSRHSPDFCLKGYSLRLPPQRLLPTGGVSVGLWRPCFLIAKHYAIVAISRQLRRTETSETRRWVCGGLPPLWRKQDR
jgi:hypothetical protein